MLEIRQLTAITDGVLRIARPSRFGARIGHRLNLDVDAECGDTATGERPRMAAGCGADIERAPYFGTVDDGEEVQELELLLDLILRQQVVVFHVCGDVVCQHWGRYVYTVAVVEMPCQCLIKAPPLFRRDRKLFRASVQNAAKLGIDLVCTRHIGTEETD